MMMRPTLFSKAHVCGSVLVIVADAVVRDLIAASLHQAHLMPLLAASSTEARRLAGEVLPDAVLVDADSPATCDWQPGRDAAPQVTTLLLSSTLQPGARHAGPGAAATFWQSKPFSPHEVARQLAARIADARATARLRCGRMEMDAELAEVLLHGDGGRVRTLHLPQAEARLLRLLVRAQGRVVRREDVLIEVGAGAHAMALRSVDQLVRRLRRRLQDCEGIQVDTVRGRGYRLQAGLAPTQPPDNA